MAFNQDENQYTHIATNTTTQVFSGKGRLHSIVVNTTAAGAITLADVVSNTTPAIAILKSSIAEGTYLFDIAISAGLCITTAAASDITVCWSKA